MSQMASVAEPDSSAFGSVPGNSNSQRKKSKSVKAKSHAQGDQIVKFLLESLATVGFLVAIWIVGWLQWSVAWVLGACILYIGGNELKKAGVLRRNLARAIAVEEKDTILAKIDELPSWVFFPDVERAEWLNKIIQQMWPYIGEFIEAMLKNQVEPKINEDLPKSLTPFKFEEIDLGEIPPRVGGVKVYIDKVNRNEIVMDIQLSYAGDADIVVSVKHIHAGIKDIQLHGTARIVVRPLINKIPIIGGFTVCFLSQPKIDFDLTYAANILDLLRSTLRNVVSDQVAKFLVLPNRIPIRLTDDFDFSSGYHFRHPQGVVRLHVIEAAELEAGDAFGTSDPYCKIIARPGLTFETQEIPKTIKPTWNKSFEFLANDVSGQKIEFEVLDRDSVNQDDPLGITHLDLERLKSEGNIDEWLVLTKVKSGRLHIRSEFLYLRKNPNNPNRVKASGNSDHTLSTAVLLVSVDSAKSLPQKTNEMVDPSPLVKLHIGNQEFKTKVKAKTSNPVWEEEFQFFVFDPESQDLIVEVLDNSDRDKKIGICNIKLINLLSCKNMEMSQPFDLKEAMSECTLTLHIALRVLISRPTEEESLEDEDVDATAAEPEKKKSVETLKEVKEVNNPKGDGMAASKTVVSVNTSKESVRYRGPTVPTAGRFGRIRLTIRYSSQRSQLVAVVHQCQNLIVCDTDNFSDPYVKLFLLPDRSSSSKKKTQKMKNNLNPMFDETFEWPLTKQEVTKRTLEVMVINHIGMFEKKTRTEMGVIRLNLSEFGDLNEPVTQWYDLQDPDATAASKLSNLHQS